MAIIFELFVECATKPGADELIAHFDGLEQVLLSDKKTKWGANHLETPAGFGLFVSSSALSGYGVRSVQDAVELAEAGLRLLHHLKSAPPFRFARAALEASAISSADLAEYFWTDARGNSHTNLDCVIDEELYQRLGRPKYFLPFRPGYWWNKFHGEVYRPIGSNDQPALDEIRNRLFPGEHYIF